MENKSPAPRTFPLLASLLALALPLVAIGMSNHPGGAISGMGVLALLFFFPGYLFLTLVRTPAGALRILLSPILGIITVTTTYNFLTRVPVAFSYSVLAISCTGVLIFLLHFRWASVANSWNREDYESVIAGAAVALTICPLDWRSGRFSHGDLTFYGPAGQDPLFHVTMVQRLLRHVPPDNFIVAGLPAPIYHYFDDLALAMTLKTQHVLHLGSTDLFDLFYRCYPTILYFLLGALTYRVARRLLGSVTGGFLGLLLVLGAGGLGFVSGLLKTIIHSLHPAEMRSLFFSDWTGRNGVDPLLPLVHRPAHYHSLLICLGVINLLMAPQRRRRDWITAGLMLGLMAGFNFTLAATLGIAAVLAFILFWTRNSHIEARNLAWLAAFTFVGSLPVVASMLSSGFHSQAPGFPFRGPNLEFTTALAHGTFNFMPTILVPFAALIAFPFRVYGVRLAGCWNMFRLDLGGSDNRAFAAVLSITFGLSFIVGTFFPYKAQGGIAVVFIQPTLLILALFSLAPLAKWLQHNRGSWWSVALWGMLALAWIEALGSFNFGRKALFPRDTAAVLQEIRAASAPDDVVAYLPSSLTQNPVWGISTETTNFSITALTGLDGYVSSDYYSTAFAVPGLQGKTDNEIIEKAQHLYRQRRDEIESFICGGGDGTQLARDNVRWVVVSGEMARDVTAPNPWRRTSDLVVYKLR